MVFSNTTAGIWATKTYLKSRATDLIASHVDVNQQRRTQWCQFWTSLQPMSATEKLEIFNLRHINQTSLLTHQSSREVVMHQATAQAKLLICTSKGSMRFCLSLRRWFMLLPAEKRQSRPWEVLWKKKTRWWTIQDHKINNLCTLRSLPIQPCIKDLYLRQVKSTLERRTNTDKHIQTIECDLGPCD